VLGRFIGNYRRPLPAAAADISYPVALDACGDLRSTPTEIVPRVAVRLAIPAERRCYSAELIVDMIDG
jgi:hypothetical protein